MVKKSDVLIINGPNLNMLGKRDKKQYGVFTLRQLNSRIKKYAEKKNITPFFYQSNIEGEIVTKIQSSQNFNGIIINAGGYTHTSVSIRDSIELCSLPVVEVHLSNVSDREKFRHTSLLTPVCEGVIAGFGLNSYLLAIEFFDVIFSKKGY
ncbi:MAG: type II 3-dehydroquinate dehydratase [Candidatus Muiribacteriota bacterium]